MGTTPHPPLHTIMQQWDAKPAPRTFPSLRPATTPRWSGTPGPSPTRRSLLCENIFNYTWILGKCKRKLFVKGNGQYPSGLVNSASSPDGAPFCAGFAREKASPSGEVAERQRWPEGLSPLATKISRCLQHNPVNNGFFFLLFTPPAAALQHLAAAPAGFRPSGRAG